MIERDVEDYFIWAVAMMGGLTWKTKAIGRVGFPDQTAILPGATWLVELKQPKGRLAEAQKLFAADCARLRVNYACLWNVAMVDAWVKGRGFVL